MGKEWGDGILRSDRTSTSTHLPASQDQVADRLAAPCFGRSVRMQKGGRRERDSPCQGGPDQDQNGDKDVSATNANPDTNCAQYTKDSQIDDCSGNLLMRRLFFGEYVQRFALPTGSSTAVTPSAGRKTVELRSEAPAPLCDEPHRLTTGESPKSELSTHSPATAPCLSVPFPPQTLPTPPCLQDGGACHDPLADDALSADVIDKVAESNMPRANLRHDETKDRILASLSSEVSALPPLLSGGRGRGEGDGASFSQEAEDGIGMRQKMTSLEPPVPTSQSDTRVCQTGDEGRGGAGAAGQSDLTFAEEWGREEELAAVSEGGAGECTQEKLEEFHQIFLNIHHKVSSLMSP